MPKNKPKSQKKGESMGKDQKKQNLEMTNQIDPTEKILPTDSKLSDAKTLAVKKLDIELEAPADFTSPEELYKDLIATIRRYHPSDDISMIEKQIWSWIRKALRQV